MEIYHKQISNVVRDYITFNAWEYEQHQKVHMPTLEVDPLINKHAELKNSDLIERALFNIPENLHTDLKMKLDDDAYLYYKSKEGARWFARSFPQFRITTKV